MANEVQISVPASLGLSADQIAQLQQELQGQLIDIVRGHQAEATVTAIPKSQTVPSPTGRRPEPTPSIGLS